MKFFRPYNKQTEISLANRKTTLWLNMLAIETKQQFGFHEVGVFLIAPT